MPLQEPSNGNRSVELLQELRDLTERSVTATEEWRRELRRQNDEAQKAVKHSMSKVTWLMFVVLSFGIIIGALLAVAIIFAWSTIRTAMGGA